MPGENQEPLIGQVASTENQEVRQLSIGEQRVRTTFNPSNNSIVDQLKQKTADLINLVEELKIKDGRAAAEAQTYYQNACMWAVYAATA